MIRYHFTVGEYSFYRDRESSSRLGAISEAPPLLVERVPCECGQLIPIEIAVGFVPNPRQKHARLDGQTIYALQCDEAPHVVKVGRSNNPNARAEEIGIENGGHWEVVGRRSEVYDPAEAGAIEKEILSALKAYKYPFKNEYFYPDPRMWDLLGELGLSFRSMPISIPLAAPQEINE